MSSKDKLIEFLKSASVEHTTENYTAKQLVVVELPHNYIDYIFDLQGNYIDTEVY